MGALESVRTAKPKRSDIHWKKKREKETKKDEIEQEYIPTMIIFALVTNSLSRNYFTGITKKREKIGKGEESAVAF